MLAGLFLALLPALCLVLFFGYYDYTRRNRELEKDLEGTIGRFASVLTGEFRFQLGFLRTLSQTLTLVPPGDPERCPELLRAFQKTSLFFLNLGVIGKDGYVRCSALPVTQPIYLGERRYFQEALRRNGFSVGSYQIGYITGAPSLNFGYPLYSSLSREPSGVVYVAVDLKYLEEILRSQSLIQGVEAILLDHQGVVLAHRGELLKVRLGVPWEALKGHLEPGFMHREMEGKPFALAVTALSLEEGAPDLYLVMATPLTSFWKMFLEEEGRVLFLLSLFFALSALLSFFLLRGSVLSPVEKSIATLKEAHRGGAPLTLSPDLPSELRPLYETFAQLQEDLVREKKNLEDTNRLYRLLLEHVPFPIALHMEGKLIYVNPEALRFIRARAPEEVLGRSPLEFVHPEDRPRVTERTQRMLRDRVPAEKIEERFLRQDGTIAIAEVVAVPVPWEGKLAIIVAIHDITELKEAYQRLVEEEERLSLALSAGKMGVLELFPEREVIVVDGTFALTLGLPGEGTYPFAQFLERIHPEDRPHCAAFVSWCKPGETSVSEVRLQDPSLPQRWIRSLCRLSPLSSGEQRIIGIAYEITAQKEAERVLLEAKARAEELNRLKSVFLAQISHELRTPITSILGYTQLLMRKLADTSHGEHLRVMKGAGERLLRMVNEVIALSRLEANELPVHPREILLAPLVEEAVRMVEPKRAERGIPIVQEIPENLCAYADPDLIFQVLLNLLQNALEFTREGSITVRAYPEEDFCVVEVEDTGEGIPEAFLPLLFQPFRQASEGLRRTHEGAGLGLAISKGYVERMGGTITVRSRLGKGSLFRVTLPLKKEGLTGAP